MPSQMQSLPARSRTLFAFLLAGLLFLPAHALAQSAPRIAAIRNGVRATLTGSRPPRALTANDTGALAPDTPIPGITIVFSRSTTQEAALQTLLAAQQNPASPLYHQWLTPDQFAASFGMADSDLATVQTWLQQQGFTVIGANRSKTAITFSGTAAQVNAAFGTELHNYRGTTGETHFAPSTDLTIPAALSSAVLSVRNLSNYRLKPHMVARPAALAPASGIQPNFTSGQSGSHFLSPKDVATIYDINAAYNAGYTGTGQSIAVIGQSAIVTSDISNFQTAAGFPVKLPTQVLVPNSGTATVYASDEAESDLDLEYSGTIAKGANIYFVYTGSSTNYDVISALEYAIDTRIAPILTLSYGDCEYDTGQAEITSLDSFLAQASAQGQTFINSAGDSGSTSCYGDSISTALQEQLNASYPASSPYATAVGGTEFVQADTTSTASTYWNSSGTTDLVSSAIQYIPETAWNDDSSTNGLSSGGGGISTYEARPTWQTGVPGIPSGTYRLVPDVSLDSSALSTNAPYLYCSSAGSSTTGVTGSCANGFRDSTNTYLTVAGGTSFAAPIFAGMLAIIEQRIGGNGLGNINPTLYSLASNSITYSTAFHDITSGNNECLAGANYCSTAGASAYTTGTGYDEATGLGSVDLNNLMTAWSAYDNALSGSVTTLPATTTSLTPATSTPAPGVADAITITVAPSATGSSTVPSGTVNIYVDGTLTTPSLTLANGKATYTFSSNTTGAHIVSATYTGSSTLQGSTGSTALSIQPAGAFTLSAPAVTIAQGNSGTVSLTITPSGGYNGTIAFNATAAGIGNTCYTVNNATVSGTAAVSTTLTIYTSATTCNSTSGAVALRHTGSGSSASLAPAPASPFGPARSTPAAAAILGGLALAGVLGRKRRNLRLFAALLVLGSLGLFVSGCSDSGGVSPTVNDAAKGTYTVNITAADTTTTSISATTSFTLTVN